MTPAAKREFIRSLIAAVQKNVLSKVQDMPGDWDGHELRRYIADKFDHEAYTVGGGGPIAKNYRSRTRAYRNAVATLNL